MYSSQPNYLYKVLYLLLVHFAGGEGLGLVIKLLGRLMLCFCHFGAQLQFKFRTPYHPEASLIPAQQLRNRKVLFQQQWFKTYPWLHYDADKKAILCFTCAKASSHDLLKTVKCAEPNFIETGYANWKKATGQDGRFETHQASNCHRFASQALQNLQEAKPVATLLSQQLSAEQSVAQKCLRVLFTTAGFLGRQGLAFRGHDEQEGNFAQLLKIRSLDVPEMQTWLKGKSSYTHHSIQDEMLKLYADATLRRILARVHKSHSFAVIVDGTQDITRCEQESMCIRHVDDELQPHEEFVGFYKVEGTRGNMLATSIKDCLIRYQLPLENLRGQTYDGASNMSGAYKGCQAIIASEQPLAAYVHCSAHCTNLVASAVCLSSAMVRDSVQLVNDFGVLCSASGNFKTIFHTIASSYSNTDESTIQVGPVRNIKPLCPTRWLVRMPAINATLQQYKLILRTLQEAQLTCSSDVSVRAAGLQKRFQNPSTVMCLIMAQNVIEPLESLNRSLQSVKMTVAGMLESAKTVRSQLQSLREDCKYDAIFKEAEQMIESLDLGELSTPRTKNVPTRFRGLALAFHPQSVLQHFKVEYLKLVDVAIRQLSDRIIDCPGLIRYCELEAMLLSGKVNEKISQQYPELKCLGQSFQTQLDMFHSVHTPLALAMTTTRPSLHSCCEILRGMVPAMRAMFPHVEELIRLLLVNPASSATAERSFSSLRRLKTYLRSTCGQRRLNNLAICHVHKHLMDEVNVDELMQEFIQCKDNRGVVFGHVSTGMQ